MVTNRKGICFPLSEGPISIAYLVLPPLNSFGLNPTTDLASESSGLGPGISMFENSPDDSSI